MKPDHELNIALDDLQFKYERMAALISVMQMYTEECVDISGAPKGAVSDSLYEIELGLREANKELKNIICKGRIVSKEVFEQRVKSA